jgi:hypothetical protein
VNLFRTSDELDTLRDDIQAVRRDLNNLSRDIGHLTGQAWRVRGAATDWLQRQTGVDLASRRGREQALEQLRAQGGRSAAMLRSTAQDHPLSTAVGAVAIGLIFVWMLTRSSEAK